MIWVEEAVWVGEATVSEEVLWVGEATRVEQEIWVGEATRAGKAISVGEATKVGLASGLCSNPLMCGSVVERLSPLPLLWKFGSTEFSSCSSGMEFCHMCT